MENLHCLFSSCHEIPLSTGKHSPAAPGARGLRGEVTGVTPCPRHTLQARGWLFPAPAGVSQPPPAAEPREMSLPKHPLSSQPAASPRHRIPSPRQPQAFVLHSLLQTPALPEQPDPLKSHIHGIIYVGKALQDGQVQPGQGHHQTLSPGVTHSV